MVRVAVVSPLPAVRAGLRAMLEAVPDYHVVAEAGGAAAPALHGLQPPAEVVVVDAPPGTTVEDVLQLAGDLGGGGPGRSGPGGSDLGGGHLGGGAPSGSGLVILGPVEGDGRLPGALGHRAFAYLARDALPEQIAAAVQAAAGGLVVLDPAVAGHLLLPGGPPEAARPAAGEALTPREREVLQLVAEGLPNKLIARRLHVSEHTVKFHVASVLAKLGATSRTEAARLGTRRGLVSL